MADKRKVLINLHTTGTSMPDVSSAFTGELVISHPNVDDAKIFTKVTSGNGETQFATFIAENEIDKRISSAVTGSYSGLVEIVQNLADMTITEIVAENPLSAGTKAIIAESCGNTVTISHTTGATNEQSGFKKLSSNAYGHVTAGTDVTMSDISGLTGFQEAVRAVETKLSSGTTGDGNAVTDIQVSDHEITFVKGEKFAISGHTHDADEIVSGVFDIARIPTAPVSSTASGTVATGEQIQTAIDNALTSSMNYKGATSSLPSSAKAGDFYVADAQIVIPAASSAKGTAVTAETGDYIIARTSGDTATTATWDVIEKNLDGAVTSTAMTADYIVLADGSNTIKSVDPASVLVGSATTASSAETAVSATSIDLSGVQNADDLKAIEALTATTGVLKKTAANTWELVDVIDTVADFSGLTASGNLVDAKVVKDVITENERVTSAALNDLNDRIIELSGSSSSDLTALSGSVIALSGSVIALSGATAGIEDDLEALSGAVTSLTFTQYASAITINGASHSVSNNGVDLGSYLSASTAHITSITESETVSAKTTTINYVKEDGTASAATITQDYIIDCGEY